MKKMIAMLTAVISITANSICFAENNETKLFLDGTEMPFINSETQIKYVPIRNFSDKLGFDIQWNNEKRTATLSNKVKTIIFTLDNNEVYIYDDTENVFKMENKPMLQDGRVMISLNDITKILEINIDTTQDIETEEINIKLFTVDFNTKTFDGLADDGTKVYEAKVMYPKIISYTNSEVINNLNQQFEEMANSFIKSCEDGEEFKDAKEYYKYLKEEKEEFITIYSNIRTYDLEYRNSSKISFRVYDSMYTGGAHPYTALSGEVYSTETGEKLSITDILDISEEEAKALIIKGITEDINKNPGFYFEEAITDLNDIANISNFYITDEGVAFFFNPYEIAPYAAGYPTYLYKCDIK